MQDKLREYRYGVNNEVKFNGEWYRIDSVDFGEEIIALTSGLTEPVMVSFKWVEDIREGINR